MVDMVVNSLILRSETFLSARSSWVLTLCLVLFTQIWFVLTSFPHNGQTTAKPPKTSANLVVFQSNSILKKRTRKGWSSSQRSLPRLTFVASAPGHMQPAAELWPLAEGSFEVMDVPWTAGKLWGCFNQFQVGSHTIQEKSPCFFVFLMSLRGPSLDPKWQEVSKFEPLKHPLKLGHPDYHGHILNGGCWQWSGVSNCACHPGRSHMLHWQISMWAVQRWSR